MEGTRNRGVNRNNSVGGDLSDGIDFTGDEFCKNLVLLDISGFDRMISDFKEAETNLDIKVSALTQRLAVLEQNPGLRLANLVQRVYHALWAWFCNLPSQFLNATGMVM